MGGEPWIDPEFLPSPESLCPPAQALKKRWEDIQWLRSSEIFSIGEGGGSLENYRLIPDAKEVPLKGIDDIPFQVCLKSIGSHEGRLNEFFSNDYTNESGVYCITLYHNHQIKQVIVDDFLPINRNSRPAFALPFAYSMQMLLIQKAWAKIHGCYEATEGMAPLTILNELTGAPTFRYNVSQYKDQLF